MLKVFKINKAQRLTSPLLHHVRGQASRSQWTQNRNMNALYLAAAVFIFLSIGITYNCKAGEITNYNDLIENGKALDGKEVILKGEAIGEPMKRGGYTWVNISDGSTAIGIWMKNSDADRINFYGNYKVKGDKVRITGEFHRACAEHGGDMDIHALSVEIDEAGHFVNLELNKSRLKTALGLSLVTVLLGVVLIKK